MGTIAFDTTFSRALDIYKESWKVLVPIAIVFNLIIGVVAAVLVLAGLAGGGLAGFAGGGAIGAGVGALVGMVVGMLILVAISVPVSLIQSGVLVRGAGDYDDGGTPAIGEVLEASKPWGGLINTAFLLAAIAIGLVILFIIPIIGWFGVPILAVYLFTRWSLTVPVIVYEGRSGKDAMDRSAELVSGQFWVVLGISVVGGIAIGIVTNILGKIVSVVIPSSLSMVETVVGIGINGIGAPFMAMLMLLMYRQATGGAAAGGSDVEAYAAAPVTPAAPAAPAAPIEPAAPAEPTPPAEPNPGQ